MRNFAATLLLASLAQAISIQSLLNAGAAADTQINSSVKAVADTHFQNFAETGQNARVNKDPVVLAQTKFGMPSAPEMPSAPAMPAMPATPAMPSAPAMPSTAGLTGAADDAKKKADAALADGKSKAAGAQSDAQKQADDAKAKAQGEVDKQKAAGLEKVGIKSGDAAADGKVSPAAIVIKGQWVKNEEGKDLILFDPTDQAYDVMFADKQTNAITKFDKDDD